MSLLTDGIRSEREYSHFSEEFIRQLAAKKPKPLLVTGLCDGAADAFLVSAISDFRKEGGCALIICPDEKLCGHYSRLLCAESLRASAFLARDLTFYNISASHEYEHERLMVLYGLLLGRLDAVVTTPEAALGYTIPPTKLIDATVSVSSDSTLDPDKLTEKLLGIGYRRVELVDSPGQFARRGGIIDIYPPFGDYLSADGEGVNPSSPLRIELFGDEVDRMGVFDPRTQRLTARVNSAKLPPAREVICDTAMLGEIRKTVSRLVSMTKDDIAKEELRNEESAITEAINTGNDVSFTDKYISKIYTEKASLLDYFPERSRVFLKNPSETAERLKASVWHSNERIKELVSAGTVSPKYAEYSKEPSALDLFYDRSATVFIDSIARGLSSVKLGGMFTFRSRHTVSYSGNLNMLTEDLATYRDGGWRVLVAAGNDTEAANLAGMLTDNGFNAIVGAESGEFNAADIPAGTVIVTSGATVSGYELIIPKLAVLSTVADERTAGAAAARLRRRAKKRKGGEAIMSFNELTVGDYVVHENYGIGQYEGIENLTINGVSRDYIHIKYAGSDKLFLPTDKLDMISKYIGAHADDGLVKLSKFGGAEWGKAKAKAKAAVKEIAKDLIKLYAERMRRPGHAFPPDDDFQRDFEAAFEYDETDSQLSVTEEIKEDMERPVPMDRLLCGDVGFGKTEVAFRAAYKAILDGKQVAILVPTTLLALQHYQTAQSRMRTFPVNIDMLSRFRTPKQQAATLRAVRRGEVDLLIGTHRMLSKDIEFNDLGLLIIDEEQRFGVAQKEKIKQLAGNIDVLTLTATPIPRTLNMAMSGIRDISVLDEAPGDRLPVQTYVLEDDDLIIFEAIRRELRRGGQVFYLHNMIETIDSVASRLSAAFPEARIVTAHGKMEKDRLEDIWRSMLTGETDILVCTSIIETGIDVPNANTLIVDNAQRLGLSQLHQIRGRVGRSPRRAYAYFTFPKGRALSEIAEKRLEAIREYAEFGAGFRIAMRDLELRGAGNLLGAEQHGHLDAIGYDLYIKLLHEAVLEEQGKPVAAKHECTVSFDINAYIPEKYVKYQPQRMALYKKIAMIENEDDMSDILDELSDRFGEPPEEVMNLLRTALLRAYAVKCGFTKVTQNGGNLNVYPEKLIADVWQELSDKTGVKLRAVIANEPYITFRVPSGADPVGAIKDMFAGYLEISQKNR